MTERKPRKHVKLSEYFAGRNFMTPDVIEYGLKGDYVYELTVGTGMRRQLVYGVLVMDKYTGERVEAKSELFQSLDAARTHIRYLDVEA